VALYRALGAAVPKYAHLPMIVNRQGKPYSKRDGAAYVGEFRDKGYHADALFNYLALLGWSPGDDREKMTRAEMIAAFTLDRVKSGPAQMDLQKLTHLNQLYLSEMPLTDFATRLRPFREGAEWAAGIDEDYFLKVSALLQSRTTTLMQVREWGYFFTEPLAFDPKAVAKLLANPASKAGLARVRDELGRSEFTAAAIEKTMHDIEAEVDLSQGKLNQPVRLAITGRTIGAGLYETMELLGRERVLRRLDYAVARLCAQAGEPA
jgi:glutamyl/glutaminyl-tRNA synthetase